MVALTFLKTNQVISGFERLSMEVGDDCEMILNYFEELYIGKVHQGQKWSTFIFSTKYT